jgi:uncharacterized protein (DUF302 family)
MQYFLAKKLEGSFEAACERVTALLAEQGFAILTEIDMKSTFQTKLGLEHRPYKILGSCNAELAQQAIGIEPQIGALMPCNWTVQWLEDGVEVSVMNPAGLVGITGNEALQPVQDEVERRMQAVLAAL